MLLEKKALQFDNLHDVIIRFVRSLGFRLIFQTN
jgi:hypothetical protein